MANNQHLTLTLTGAEILWAPSPAKASPPSSATPTAHRSAKGPTT